MKLIYYSSEKGNVGDELNVWLWNRIFPGHFENDNDKTAFLGIGSILLENSVFIDEASAYKKKIICGTGVRSISERLNLDNSWHISFLRGPYSSLKLTHSLDNYISDSAYFVVLTDEFKKYKNLPKKHKVSVIPYFQSMDKLNWEKVCKHFDWNLITTETKDVDYFLSEIASSELVISEAMHGAILADVLRVPWRRLKFYAHLYEGENVSEFKWNDWLSSVEIYEDQPIEFGKRSLKKGNFITRQFYKSKYEKRLIKKLSHAAKEPYQLSSDKRFDQIVSQIESKRIEILKHLSQG